MLQYVRMEIDVKLIKRMTGLKALSTNSCASTFDEIGSNDVIIAREQKYGAGRGDHTFYSPRGGLYIVVRETGLSIDAHTLTPAVGLAVHDAIRACLKIDTELKWVNDVMYQGKKAAGILVRSPRRGEYLIGIGINYATEQKALIAAKLHNAITLAAPESKATDFCINLLKRVHLYAISPFDVDRYNSLCRTVGKTVKFTRGGVDVTGYAEGVERDGSLLVRLGMATVAVDAGEVSEVREQ